MGKLAVPVVATQVEAADRLLWVRCLALDAGHVLIALALLRRLSLGRLRLVGVVATILVVATAASEVASLVGVLRALKQ